MSRFSILGIVLLTSVSLTQPAWAINCMSKDTDKIKVMYKAYVLSGTLPTSRMETYKDIGTSGVQIHGIITGITEFESCWKDNPPCDTKAEFETAQINYLSSADEIKNMYGGNANNGIIECFRKLGLASQDKTSNIFQRITR